MSKWIKKWSDDKNTYNEDEIEDAYKEQIYKNQIEQEIKQKT